MNLYLVTARRYGRLDTYSYTVGIFDNKSKAVEASSREQNERGIKYRCDIEEIELNKYDPRQGRSKGFIQQVENK